MSDLFSTEDLQQMTDAAKWAALKPLLEGGVPSSTLSIIAALFERAAQAPDPNALPLSTALREARRRTEAGDETWVVMTMPTWDRPKLLRIEDWCWYTNRPGWPAWVSAWASAFEQIETVVCKLVTPWEGERILRGESGE